MACSHGANVPEAICRIWIIDKTTLLPREAINRKTQWVATGATAALTAILRYDHTIAYPGCGASNQIMVVASPYLPHHSSVSQVPRQRRSETTENTDSRRYRCIIPIGKNIDNTQYVVCFPVQAPNSYHVRYVSAKQTKFNSIRLKKNVFFYSKVSFINTTRAHGLETKEAWTGPTAAVGATIIYDTCCYYCRCTLSIRLVSLTTRYDIII